MAATLPRSPTLRWEPFAALALVAATLGLAFSDTLEAMVRVWRSSESFAHGPLIPVASAWLIWRKRAQLRELRMEPWWPAAIPIAAAGFGWLLGRLAGVNTLEQFAVVGMIPALVALILGWRIAWALAFPLCFLFFAVPFGTFLLDPMMDRTADFTVLAVKLSGIPVLREGNSFTLPSGRWSVVESCSGVRYLLAALPLGCLYAYLSYESVRTRLVFMAVMVMIALVSNWMRAYLIVMLGHLSGMKIAVGADHLIYGWVFFGIVMALAFWLGSYLPDRAAPPSEKPRKQSLVVAPHAAKTLIGALIGSSLLLAWPNVAREVRTVQTAVTDLTPLATALSRIPNLPADAAEYRPQYSGAHRQLTGRSRAAPEVGLQVSLFVNQEGQREMLREGNRVMPGGADDPRWQVRRRRTLAPEIRGNAFPTGPVNEYVIGGPSGRYLVWEWFQVREGVFTSPARTKAATALAMLRGKGDESLAWVVWAPLAEDESAARNRMGIAADLVGAVHLDAMAKLR